MYARLAVLLAAGCLMQANAGPRPFFDHPVTIPGTLQMHWFDQGGQGVAYHDSDPGNPSKEARTDEGVDFGRDGGDIYLGWLAPDEWASYTLNVADHAAYRIDARVAAEKPGGHFNLEFSTLDGRPITSAKISVPATGGWTTWQLAGTSATLPKGPLRMRFVHLSGETTYNVDRIRFCRYDPLDVNHDGVIDARDRREHEARRTKSKAPGATAALAPADESDLVDALGGEEQFRGKWKLVWSDEFETDGPPDPEKWRYELGYKIRNNELQHYTKGANAFVEDGHLVLEARREPSKTRDGRTADYTSTSMSPRTSWTYGRIEVRAKVPTGRGMWPAIWMLADRIRETGWPQCGEIDIMENVGYDPHAIHASVHTKKYNHVINTQQTSRLELPAPWETFHVYAIEWYPDRIDFFIDRTKYMTFANEGSGDDAWPFDNPHTLKLNIAVGGAWGAVRGVDDSIFPQRMTIDYVRVYDAVSK